MNNKHSSLNQSVIIVSSLFVVVLSLAPPNSAESAKSQPIVLQSTDFEVGRRPEAMMFDGNNIWVANQQSDSIMKLRPSDGTNLGTFETGARPVALTYDGTHVWVANRMSNNVMKFLAKDGSLVDTIAVGQQP
jgi:hypothetical protein